MAREELATVRLFRFDPETDAEPGYVEFKVPYKGHTVLNVLTHIFEKLDSSFSFRWACKQGHCRSCVVQVNGRSVLCCKEPAGRHMTIEPHPKFKVIKDLVVDFNKAKGRKGPSG
jgi:succinate dehydrogenase/fumarate reductase iron-sulfur protein